MHLYLQLYNSTLHEYSVCTDIKLNKNPTNIVNMYIRLLMLPTSSIVLLLDVMQKLGVHRCDVHEEFLNWRVVSDASSSWRVTLHAIYKYLYLGLQVVYELFHLAVWSNSVLFHFYVLQSQPFSITLHNDCSSVNNVESFIL